MAQALGDAYTNLASKPVATSPVPRTAMATAAHPAAKLSAHGILADIGDLFSALE